MDRRSRGATEKRRSPNHPRRVVGGAHAPRDGRRARDAADPRSVFPPPAQSAGRMAGHDVHPAAEPFARYLLLPEPGSADEAGAKSDWGSHPACGKEGAEGEDGSGARRLNPQSRIRLFGPQILPSRDDGRRRRGGFRPGSLNTCRGWRGLTPTSWVSRPRNAWWGTSMGDPWVVNRAIDVG